MTRAFQLSLFEKKAVLPYFLFLNNDKVYINQKIVFLPLAFYRSYIFKIEFFARFLYFYGLSLITK